MLTLFYKITLSLFYSTKAHYHFSC